MTKDVSHIPHAALNTMDMTRGCRIDRCKASGEMQCTQCTQCQKLVTHDSFGGAHNAALPADIVEVRFKHTHKEYFKTDGLLLNEGDVVAVETTSGHNIGVISLTGDLVYRQMLRLGLVPETYDFKRIYRKARGYDFDKWNDAISMEYSLMVRARKMSSALGLNMKIGDVEMFGDKAKAIFYYIADERVDFRELIKVMADEFKIRIEMRQIGARQEAGRIGAIGICGREVCCASFMSNFAAVSTNAARDQDFSTNPQKLTGQCNKLKCCLNYELSTYVDLQKDFPKNIERLETLEGTVYLHKTDIFKRLIWYNFEPDSMDNLVAVPVERVIEIQALNRAGKAVESLLEGRFVPHKQQDDEPAYKSAVGEDNIARFDRRKKQSGFTPKQIDRKQERPRNRRERGERGGNRRPHSQEQPAAAGSSHANT